MTAIMRPAGAPGGLRLDAMTPAAALRSAAGVASWGFKSLARKTRPVSAVTAGRELSAVSSKQEVVTVLLLVAGLADTLIPHELPIFGMQYRHPDLASGHGGCSSC